MASEKKSAKVADVALISSSDLFNAEWYVSRYKPDLSKGQDPAAHYLAIGGPRGLSASPKFISAAYLALYPDVARSNANPLLHYLKKGRSQDRQAVARADLAELGLENMGRQEQQSVATVAGSGLFDEAFYRARNPDVAASGIHPILHYVRNGLEKRLDPGPGFDAKAYLAAHPEAAETLLPPLVHFERFARVASEPAPGPAESDPEQSAARADRATITEKRRDDAWPTTGAETAGAAGAPEYPPLEAREAYRLDEADAVARLGTTPFFDPAWYLKRNPDVARSGTDPATHYVRTGAAEGRRPSVYFDPEHYVEQVPELRDEGCDPLIHFLTVGRAQGRTPSPLLAPSRPPRLRQPGESDAPIVAAPTAEPAAIPAQWIRHVDLSQASGLTFGDQCLGLIEAPMVLAPLAAYCRLFGLDCAGVVRTGLEHEGFDAPDAVSPETYCGFGQRLAFGPNGLADAWFADERTLRLRFGADAPGAEPSAEPIVARGLQGSAAEPAKLALCGEALLPSGGPSFVDFALPDPMLPVIVVLTTPGGAVLEVSVIPFPSLIRGGAHHAELVATALRPSPMDDLRRYGDVLMRRIAATPSPAIGRISVRRRDGTGAEQVFSRSLVEWAARIFGVSIALEANDGADGVRDHLDRALTSSVMAADGAADKARLTLSLHADSIPTIAALAAGRFSAMRGADPLTGSYLVTEATTGAPRLAVSAPAMGDDLIALQPRRAAVGFPVLSGSPAEGGHAGAPAWDGTLLSIRRRRFGRTNEVLMSTPLAPDADDVVLGPPSGAPPDATVTALVLTRDPLNTLRLVESLAAQTDAHRLRVRIRFDPFCSADFSDLERAAARLFPGRSDVAPASGGLLTEIAAAAAASQDPYLLIASGAVVAHDARTLASLLAMMGAPDVASAGCVVVREHASRKTGAASFESAGYFPSHVSFMDAPRLVLAAPNCLEALPDATYPVIANQLDFTLLKRDAAVLMDAPSVFAGARADVTFGVLACAAGMRHLCTSAVRVVSVGEPGPSEVLDPVGGLDLSAGEWERILSSVTLVRELRP